jgi:hypothetical protein
MRSLLPLLLLVACVAPNDSSQQGPPEFRSLFNGVDLEGWVPVNTAPSTWVVRDNMLHCTGKPTGELRTDRMYQNFVLELEWRHLVPGGNAGVFVWADDITSVGVPFHRSVEVQVLDHAYGNTRGHTTHGDIFPIHGAVMTPINGRGSSRAFPTELHSKPSPEWNHYSITCIDGAISLKVNGVMVTQGTDANPRMGYICLESEGGEVDYRNLQIKELPGGILECEQSGIFDRGYSTIYTGVNHNGWEGDLDEWQVQDWRLVHKASAGTATIIRQFALADFGFLADVHLKDQDSRATIRLRGNDATQLEIALDAPLLGKHLHEGWNRIEVLLEGNSLWITVNSHTYPEPKTLKPGFKLGPLSIEGSGEVALASLFVRSVDGKR